MLIIVDWNVVVFNDIVGSIEKSVVGINFWCKGVFCGGWI